MQRLLIGLCALLLLSACGQREKLVDVGTREQIFHVGNGAEPSDIDPHSSTGMPEAHIQMALFEGLVAKNPKTLDVVPGVAERWETSEDGLIYNFYIRQSARWSNGDALTAHDFVASWKRALTPTLGNPYISALYPIKHAEQFGTGEITDFSEVGVKALSDHHLRVELREPTPYFLQLMDHHSAYPVHIPTIIKHGAIDEKGTRWTRPENFVGNGPFIPNEWTPMKMFSVVRNPHYWDADTVKLNEIRFYPIPKTTVEERMFVAGQIHKTNAVSVDKIERYKRERPEDYQGFTYFGTYYYNINVTKPPLDDARVRRALAYSIDREALTRAVTKGGQEPALSFVPPNPNGYTSKAFMEFNIEKAQQLLAEAGYPNGKGFPEIELSYNTLEAHQKIAVAIQQMWKKNLNINVRLQNQEWKVFLNNRKLKQYDISRSGWIGDYVDPFTFLELYTQGNPNNASGWKNAAYETAITNSTAAKTTEERFAYLQEAEAILLEEAPLIPLYFYSANYLMSSDVKGAYHNLMDYLLYKHIYLERDNNGEAARD
jgi:oligopeptide transport system substrate-binding protein